MPQPSPSGSRRIVRCRPRLCSPVTSSAAPILVRHSTAALLVASRGSKGVPRLKPTWEQHASVASTVASTSACSFACKLQSVGQTVGQTSRRNLCVKRIAPWPVSPVQGERYRLLAQGCQDDFGGAASGLIAPASIQLPLLYAITNVRRKGNKLFP